MSSQPGLTPFQIGIMEALAGMEPRWTLTGGGALVGFHLHHRRTRRLDLFLYGHACLEGYAALVIDTLHGAGMRAASQQAGTAMHRLLVTDGGDSTVVDLVAEPVPSVEAPVELALGATKVWVDTRHEILVNKLCTLVQRSELRDLFDVKELLAAGGDLIRALGDAPKKDGGFSPLTLAWLLEQLPIGAVGEAEGWSSEQVQGLEEFRSYLVQELSERSQPGDQPPHEPAG